jgi:choline monooxygenase
MNHVTDIPFDTGRFSSDPDSSFTLPGAFYFDEGVYARELDLIFGNSWQYVCHNSAIDEPGQYVVREIGDQSIFVLRDEQGNIRAFYNVCQHRAHPLLEGDGRVRSTITCPYHLWSYRLSGELKFARGSDRATTFPQDEICLTAIRTDQMAGFVFVNMDSEAAPMKEVYPGLEDDILTLAPDAVNLQQAYSRDYGLAANWKNSVENYSECYHCPNRHPSLVKEGIEINTYRITTYQNWHRHHTRSKGDAQAYNLDQSGPETVHEFGSWLVWPNLSIEVYPGGNLTTFQHIPDGPERTTQSTQWFFHEGKPSDDEQAVIDFVHLVREEDIPICESVQKGLHSRGYRQGKFMVDPQRSDISEHAVHDFQRMVIETIAPEKLTANQI